MNPKSFDSENENKMFSREEDNFLIYGKSSRPEGDEEEFRMEGEASSLAYDQAIGQVKKVNKLALSRLKKSIEGAPSEEI